MNDMLFCLLNDLQFPCPRTHALHVRKLAEGFVQRGYHFREITSSELGYLSEADILYVSNHFSTEPIHRLVKTQLQQRLAKLLQNMRASIVLWNFHTTSNWHDWDHLKQRVVHLGEDLYQDSINNEKALQEFRKLFPVLPLRYSSPLHPNHSKFFSLHRDFDFNFVGHGYQRHLTQHCIKQYRTLIRNTPPTISEVLRVNSFRRAEVNLVFHAPSNVSKGIVVERFAEALSLGGILFHDHPRISVDFPDHPSLIHVETPEQIDAEFVRIMTLSSTERDNLRQHSWTTWQQSDLSYFHQAGRIIRALGVVIERD